MPDGKLTVSELSDLLKRAALHGHGDDVIAIPYEVGHSTVGGRPYTPIKSASGGFDWDKGKFFLYPEISLGLNDEALQKQRKIMRKLSEAIGGARMALKGNRLSAEGKIEAAMSHLKNISYKDE